MRSISRGLPEKIDYESLLIYGMNQIQQSVEKGDYTKTKNEIYVLITSFTPYWVDDKDFKRKAKELYENDDALGLYGLFLTKMKEKNLLPSEDIELIGEAHDVIEEGGLDEIGFKS